MSMYENGSYEAANNQYEKIYPVFRTDGDFLMHYGKSLAIEEHYKQAIQILEQAKREYNSTIIETALGDSYKALKHYKKAEVVYQHAANMIPVRFYPNYLLVKLYDDSGQKEKAVKKAVEVLNKKVKVESIAIREIQAEMRKVIKESIE